MIKFLKPLLMTAGLSVSATLLVACGSASLKPSDNRQVALQETQSYLPQQAYDEQGAAIAYEPVENPYLTMRSKVSKGSVLLFIEAKKLKRAGNSKKAMQKLNVITQKDTALSGPWVMLGDIAFEDKQFKQAEQHYLKALAINEKNVNAYIALAKVQRIQGKFNLAQNTLADALALWPDFPEAHLNLGVLYDLYLNQSEKAQMHMEAYLFLNQFKDQQALAWYQEVQQRTGIKTSFVDSKGLGQLKLASLIATHDEVVE